MRRQINRAIIVLFSLNTTLSLAEIVDKKTMKEAATYVDAETLLLYDIDNTVMMPAQTLGGEEWFDFLVGKYVAQLTGEGISQEAATKQAISRALKEWNAVQLRTKSVPVETDAPGIIAALQKSGVKTMALTARPPSLCEYTQKSLESIGFFNAKLTIWSGVVNITEGENPSQFFSGQLCVGPGNEKGVELKKFLTRIDYRPSKIVFVDNKMKHVVNVGAIVEAMNIKYTGVRLGATDAKIAAFDAKVADIQLEDFLEHGNDADFVIMDDETARSHLK